MKWRPKWSTVTIALAVIAALAIASPVLGVSKSIKKAIKKEVSKQIGKATGPAGPAGTNGTNGTNGTARAFATVAPCAAPTTCTASRTKGVDAAVTHPSAGNYCVNAPGIDPTTTSPAVTVDAFTSTSQEGDGSAMSSSGGAPCAASTFKVLTQRANPAASTNSVNTDTVGFTIVIP